MSWVIRRGVDTRTLPGTCTPSTSRRRRRTRGMRCPAGRGLVPGGRGPHGGSTRAPPRGRVSVPACSPSSPGSGPGGRGATVEGHERSDEAPSAGGAHRRGGQHHRGGRLHGSLFHSLVRLQRRPLRSPSGNRGARDLQAKSSERSGVISSHVDRLLHAPERPCPLPDCQLAVAPVP